jgi:hypothetical protein
MESVKYKTNINCSGCIAKIAPVLDEIVGADLWTVDIQNPEKILTVTWNGQKKTNLQVELGKIGFKTEEIG